MPEKLPEVRLVLPDTGVLISLAHGNLLDILLGFAKKVRMEVTDVVAFEATRKADNFDARRIEDFFLRHGSLITVRQTSFRDYLEALKKNPDEARIPNIGELSIYGVINELRNDEPGIPTLVLFEDSWFVRNQVYRPTSTHLLSLVAFLKYVEKVVPGFSCEGAIAAIRNTRPNMALIDFESPGLNEAAGIETAWESAYRPGSR